MLFRSDKDVLKNGLMLMKTEQMSSYGIENSFYGGQSAYEKWATAVEALSGTDKIANDVVDSQNDQEKMLGEDRGYAADYMLLLAERHTHLQAEFRQCARLLQNAADCVPQMRKLRNEHGMGDKQTQTEITALIRQAAKYEKEACLVLEQILDKM